MNSQCAQQRHPCLAHSDFRYAMSEYLVYDQDPMFQLLGSKFRACHDADPAGAVTCGPQVPVSRGPGMKIIISKTQKCLLVTLLVCVCWR